MQFWSALATARQTRENFSPEMISRIAPTLLFVLATMVSAKELAVVQKGFQRTVRPIFQKFCFGLNVYLKNLFEMYYFVLLHQM